MLNYFWKSDEAVEEREIVHDEKTGLDNSKLYKILDRLCEKRYVEKRNLVTEKDQMDAKVIYVPLVQKEDYFATLMESKGLSSQDMVNVIASWLERRFKGKYESGKKDELEQIGVFIDRLRKDKE